MTGVPSPEKMYLTVKNPLPSSQEYPAMKENTLQSKKANSNNALVETKKSTKETSALPKSSSQQQKLKEMKTGKVNLSQYVKYCSTLFY